MARPSARVRGVNGHSPRLGCGEPVLLLFSKAWGLTSEALANADYLLEPIDLRTGYNHLSVRSAVSIIVDRVLGRDP